MIARRAGLGAATVYRHFPQRDELVSALFESQMDAMVAVAEEGARGDDAWAGLLHFMVAALQMQVVDRGLKELLATSQRSDRIERGRRRLTPVVDQLLDRAKTQGRLRPDIETSDLTVLMTLLSSISTPTQPDLWRRYLALVAEAIEVRSDQQELPGEAPGDGATAHITRLLPRRG